jgi:hypothetical protein
MPTTETIELARALGDMGLPVGRVVVNGVLPSLFSADERTLLEAASGEPPYSRGDAAIVAARNRAVRERLQAESLNRLSSELPIAPAILPLLMGDAANPEAIGQLAERV